MTTTDILWLIVLGIIMIVMVIGLPQLLIRRAIPDVIKIFKSRDAIGPGNAKTAEELEITSQTMVQRIWKPRDYKPRALQLLVNSNIVQMTPDGKFYISEENLDATKWGKQ